MQIIKRVLAEPLLHFFAAGAIILVLASGNATDGQDSENVITIDDGILEHLSRVHAKTWQRPPSERELAGLVQERIKEELYYREALKMGLDKDDTIIRRRLRQKLEFLAANIAEAVEPTDELLGEYLEKNGEEFREPDYLSLKSIYFDKDRRGEGANSDATRTLEQLKATPSKSWEELGDTTRLPRELSDVSLERLYRTFGADFAMAVNELSVGKWSGPIPSSFGIHLVLVDKRIPGKIPPLDNVRTEVLTEWAYERKQEIQEAFYQAMLEQYEIVMDTEAGGE
jgi:hypothetical protein